MKKADLSIRLTIATDRNRWDSVVNHPLQSWTWGEFRRSMGTDIIRFVVEKRGKLTRGSRPVYPESYQGKLVEGWQLTFHNIPYTPWTIGYFPKGPTPTQNMLGKLSMLGKEKNAIFIQIEPNVLKSLKFKVSSLKYLGPSHHPLFPKYTFVLDLTKSKEDLLEAMHPKTRYNIRIAQKHGVVVKEDRSKEAMEAYMKLSSETTKRQSFYAHNQSYHRHMWQHLHPAGTALLFTATYQQKILAAWIIFSWKDTIYYPYGASSREHRDVMAPTLLLWEIALWGKKNGYKKFDLWGALGPYPDPKDPWFGFHRFKQGFGPQLVEFIGSYDLVLNPLLYRMYKVVDTIRWKILR